MQFHYTILIVFLAEITILLSVFRRTFTMTSETPDAWE